MPDWQKEEVETARAIVNHSGDRFIDPPGKFEFNEYRHMERFIGGLPDAKAAEQLRRAIQGHGGFHHFKDTLCRLGIQDQWFRYRDEAMKEFVIGWAEANNVPYEDDIKDGGLEQQHDPERIPCARDYLLWTRFRLHRRTVRL